MKTEKCTEILLEILRVGLISARNLAAISGRGTKRDTMLFYWTELCHSLPPILLGHCDPRAVRYFLDGDAMNFLRDYPNQEEADYKQLASLMDELNVVLKTPEN